ncbi:type 1 periplasmic-binding domain-containing protein [Streptomyces sp. YIM S03343]
MARRSLGTWLREGVWATPLRRLFVLAATAVAVAGIVVLTMRLTHDDRSCAPGVNRPAGSSECVGVSATDYDFGNPKLRDTVRAITGENARLVPGSYVTVAVMLPYTSTAPASVSDVLHGLQGAYLGQYHANHDGNGESPAIRLVLANPGATSDYWQQTVEQLAGMTKSGDRLRAVAGIALSTDNNKKAVKELTRLGIPVVGSSITADDLANGQGGKDSYPGLARVAPTNTDLARALTSFAGVGKGKALLVYDKPGDPYTRTLQKAFATVLKGSPGFSQPFTPPADRNLLGTTANIFRQITHVACDTSPDTDTILFAGRHTQLVQFLNELGERGCQERKFTVLAGDTGSYLTEDKNLHRSALRRNLTVRYASLAHPDAWAKDPAPTGGSAADAQVLLGLVARSGRTPVGPIGTTALDDGQLIIGYDALQLAVQGIREAVPEGRKIPLLADVGHEWPHINGSQQRVNGASGWICLDTYGNPYDKAVPIVELTPEGGARFVRIAWPEGKPPGKSCLPPS